MTLREPTRRHPLTERGSRVTDLSSSPSSAFGTERSGPEGTAERRENTAVSDDAEEAPPRPLTAQPPGGRTGTAALGLFAAGFHASFHRFDRRNNGGPPPRHTTTIRPAGGSAPPPNGGRAVPGSPSHRPAAVPPLGRYRRAASPWRRRAARTKAVAAAGNGVERPEAARVQRLLPGLRRRWEPRAGAWGRAGGKGGRVTRRCLRPGWDARDIPRFRRAAPFPCSAL